jgi:LacI family transcriptional regulator
MPSIRDVAMRAGVSPMTVSRVINNGDHVRTETRQRVERAIADLAYIPNSLGPSLRTKRTQTLALVQGDIMNPFATMVARGVEDAANRRGYHVIFGNTDGSPSKQEEYLTFLLKKQVDGFLLVPASLRSLDTLRKRGTPFVVVDRHLPESDDDTVRGDSEGGAYALTRHLLELGHRRIAIVAGPREVSTASDRVAGYLRAMREAGLSGGEQIHWGEYKQEHGSQAARTVLLTHPLATAIFAANNFIAVGTMLALREAGIRVPEEMSVVAFDDLPLAITFDPFFTVAAQSAYEMGERATDLLLARLAGTGPPERQEIVLPIEIIVRRSSGPPPDLPSAGEKDGR